MFLYSARPRISVHELHELTRIFFCPRNFNIVLFLAFTDNILAKSDKTVVKLLFSMFQKLIVKQ
jgi:hypothetical protein